MAKLSCRCLPEPCMSHRLKNGQKRLCVSATSFKTLQRTFSCVSSSSAERGGTDTPNCFWPFFNLCDMHGSGKLRQLSLAMLLSICQHFDIYVESIKGRRKVPYLSLLREFLESCDRPLSQGGHFESQENKKLCFCTSTLALDERLDVQNLLFQHCVIKVYCHHSPCLWLAAIIIVTYWPGSTIYL